MKVLWICNVPIPRIARAAGLDVPNIAGWLVDFADQLERADGVELSVAFPVLGGKELVEGVTGGIRYFGFSQPRKYGFLPAEDQLHSSAKMREHLERIVSDVQPDLLHLFGSEYPHALVAAKAFGRPERTVLNIQGLTSFIWMYYADGLPHRELHAPALSNPARGSLAGQVRLMRARGENEKELLRHIGHVIGRTDWDRACTEQVNPALRYHFCNESLRGSFYDGTWSMDGCEPHSLFMSQAATPIKGLHYMIEALPGILRDYPDARLYVAGNDLTREDGLVGRLKISSYGLYIRKLIARNRLEGKVTFTGPLTEEQMRDRMLRSNVFVCPSNIENSPNSLGEAMLLGVPCVSSDVGGVKNLIEHGTEGYVYQANAPYMLSYYVREVFRDSERASAMGLAAQRHASRTHDREANARRLLEIYSEISE